MGGPVQLNRTYDGFRPWEHSGIVKRGGGSAGGPVLAHRTAGDVNDRRHPAPPGYGQTQYRRRFFNNIMGLLGFVEPTNMDPTRNTVDGGGPPVSPIPWSRRWFSGTFRPNWNPRLYSLYVPQEAITLQRGIVPRVVDKQQSMGQPYPNLLTHYRRYAPYSVQTKVLRRGESG